MQQQQQRYAYNQANTFNRIHMSTYKCFNCICMRVACSVPTFFAAAAVAHIYKCVWLHINFTQRVNFVLLHRLIPCAHTCFGPAAPPFLSARLPCCSTNGCYLLSLLPSLPTRVKLAAKFTSMSPIQPPPRRLAFGTKFTAFPCATTTTAAEYRLNFDCAYVYVSWA